MQNRLEYMPAHRQLELFRAKQLSPLDVLKAQLVRFQDVGPSINAFTCDHFEEALEAARESEARYKRGDARPLEGISIAVKEEYGRRGWKMTAGSMLFMEVDTNAMPPGAPLTAAEKTQIRDWINQGALFN